MSKKVLLFVPVIGVLVLISSAIKGENIFHPVYELEKALLSSMIQGLSIGWILTTLF